MYQTMKAADQNRSNNFMYHRSQPTLYDPSVASVTSNQSKINQYQVYQKLGEGSYGQVRLAKNTQSNKYYALKMISKQLVRKYGADDNINQEINNQRPLDHTNILKIIDTFDDKNYIYMVLEYCQGGNLYQLLKTRGVLNESETFIFFYQMCNALDYLHFRGIVHRDLKPENILLYTDDVIKLCDFNWSANLRGEKQVKAAFCGTIDYMAPEILADHPHDQKVDIWALGVLLYELLHGYPPFRGQNDKEKCSNIIKNICMPMDSKVSPQCSSLIRQLLTHDPKQRPTIKGVFQHPWVDSMAKQNGLFNPHPSEFRKPAPSIQTSMSPRLESSGSAMTQRSQHIPSYNTQRFLSPQTSTSESSRQAPNAFLSKTAQPPQISTNRDYGVKQYTSQQYPRPFDPAASLNTTRIPNYRNRTVWDKLKFVFGMDGDDKK